MQLKAVEVFDDRELFADIITNSYDTDFTFRVFERCANNDERLIMEASLSGLIREEVEWYAREYEFAQLKAIAEGIVRALEHVTGDFKARRTALPDLTLAMYGAVAHA